MLSHVLRVQFTKEMNEHGLHHMYSYMDLNMAARPTCQEGSCDNQLYVAPTGTGWFLGMLLIFWFTGGCTGWVPWQYADGSMQLWSVNCDYKVEGQKLHSFLQHKGGCTGWIPWQEVNGNGHIRSVNHDYGSEENTPDCNCHNCLEFFWSLVG